MITVRVSGEDVFLQFEGKDGKLAGINLEELALSRGDLVSHVLIEWCQEARDRAQRTGEKIFELVPREDHS